MKRKKLILMLALIFVSAAPDSTEDRRLSKAEQRKFATLAERFGVRTED
ncbi:MAG: hypothetical protein IIC02_12660, partial [Planctomycetes bacterium]|nr:hypothetical protein [Planctomycetota bacterium]